MLSLLFFRKTSTVEIPEPHLVLVFVLELVFNLSDDRHTGAEEDVALQMDNPVRRGWSPWLNNYHGCT